MASASIALAPMSVCAKMAGMDKTVKKKWKCARWQHARMMQTVSIYSKTISVCVRKELTANNAKLHQNDALEIHVSSKF